MTNNCAGSVCSRCGKDRVIIKTYKEKVGGSVVEYTETACPDPSCQTKVNTQLASDAVKRANIKSEQDKREVERKQRISANRSSKE